MSRHYSLKDFLRQAPDHWLKRYFHQQKLLKGFDFSQDKTSLTEQICTNFKQFLVDQRKKIESDFRDIFTLVGAKGIKALFREAKVDGLDLKARFKDKQYPDYEMVFWAFFEARVLFDRALLFAHSDDLPQRYWRQRGGIPKKSIRDFERRKAILAQALSDHFTAIETRGHRCQIDYYKRDGLDHLFVFLEDYGRTANEWEKKGLGRRQQKPAFEVIYVYSAEKGTLNVYYDGGIRTVRALQTIFGKTILKSELKDEEKPKPVYNLNLLKTGKFEFSFTPESGIEEVRIKKLGLSVLGLSSRKITLEADPSENPNAVYDLMGQVIQLEGAPDCKVCNRIPIALININQVGFQVRFVADGRRGRNSKAFSISYPDSCTLKHEGRDATLREMLVKWGLETTHSQS